MDTSIKTLTERIEYRRKNSAGDLFESEDNEIYANYDTIKSPTTNLKKPFHD